MPIDFSQKTVENGLQKSLVILMTDNTAILQEVENLITVSYFMANTNQALTDD